MNSILIYIILGLIVLGLSIYLGILLSQLNKQKQQLQASKKKMQERVAKIKESIVDISKATLQGQCDPAEACIRIYNLLKFIDCNDVYPVTAEYFKAIESLSVLKKRQELSSQEAFKEDKIRFSAEETYKNEFFTELEKIKLDIA